MVKTFKVLTTIRPRFVISYRILKALSSMLSRAKMPDGRSRKGKKYNRNSR